MALPSGYTQLQYIQSSGSQYIDTNYVPNQDTRVVLDIEFTQAPAKEQGVFGARIAYGNNMFILWAHTSLGGWQDGYGSTLNYPVGNAISGRCTVDKNKNVTSVNGTQITSHTYTTVSAGCPLFLLTINNNGSPLIGSYPTYAKVYSCKIYNNGTPVRDLVPAKNSAGTVGLYDTVNGVFYTNAGSGAFEAGPVATGAVDGNGATIIAGVSFAIKEGKAMLNGTARKITEGMTKVNGAVKKIALAAGIDVAALAISYSGAYTDQKEVVMSGKTYRLLTLTGSGTLTLPQEVTADVWLCNGGNGGGYGGTGGGGGRLKQSNGISLAVSTVCTVGAGSSTATTGYEVGASGLSSFGSISPIANQGNAYSGEGASGGGGGSLNRSRKGDNVSTVPFGDTSLFYQHSAGGGGGGCEDKYEANKNTGGAGGSNGADGSKLTSYTSNVNGGSGGTRGGGAGGQGVSSGSTQHGSSATYYGSGGGAGGTYYSKSGSWTGAGNNGAGYQGVIYVRIPYEQ